VNRSDRLQSALSFVQFDPWLAIQSDRSLCRLSASLDTRLQGTFQPWRLAIQRFVLRRSYIPVETRGSLRT
jgi:hypothetical protein